MARCGRTSARKVGYEGTPSRGSGAILAIHRWYHSITIHITVLKKLQEISDLRDGFRKHSIFICSKSEAYITAPLKSIRAQAAP